MCFCTFLFSCFLFFHVFFYIGLANIHRIGWANIKWAGDDGINHKNLCAMWRYLSFFLFSHFSFSFSHFSFSSIGAANIHRITWANIKQAGDDGDQSEELMRNSEEDHFRGGTSLSSHFVFSSTDAANIHRITWVNIVRAGGRRDQ